MEIEINSESSAMSPGPQLKKAREAAALTPDQAAEHLKITVSYIRALEEDKHEELPDRPYVLGYLRAYSRLLSLDTEALLEDYHAYFASADGGNGARGEPSAAEKSRAGLSRSAWALIVVVLLLVWAAAVMLFGESDSAAATGQPAQLVQSQSLNPVAPAEPVTASDATAEPAEPASEELPAAEMATDGIEALETGAESELSVAAQAPAELVSDDDATGLQAESEVTAPLVAAPQMDTLLFSFSGECWLEVTDANGDVLAADLFQAGDKFKAEGKAPFDVMMGNVRLVTVSLNGEIYDLKPNGFRKTLRTLVE